MKREIIFRGKRVDNGEWVEGEIIFKIMEGVKDEDPSMHCKLPNEKFGQFVDVIPETVGQFTGLLDKNGKRIFEGDVLHKMDTDYNTFNKDFSDEEFKEWEKTLIEVFKGVATMERFPSFWLENETFGYEGEKLQTPEEFEIIGNIHDNPELLK